MYHIHSSIAQWQSTRLLTVGLLVRAQLGEFIWPHGQAVKTSPFHGGNTGSNPVGVINADVAQLAEQLTCNQQVIGSSPIVGLTNEWTFSSVG